ncbi:MAG: TrmB family transcriptional regulator, partial [Nitrosopumilaceae archaeon]
TDSNSKIHSTLSNDENENFKEDLFKKLEKFGLTKNQSKVYLHLSKNGPCSANELTKLLKLPRTETYHLLSGLQNKGIVLGKFGKPNKYDSLPFEKAISILVNNEKTRIRELATQGDEIINLWEKIPSTHFNQEKLFDNRFQVLKGINPILGKLKQLIQPAQEEILILGSEKDFLKFYHTDFFKIIKSKANLKMLISCSNKTEFIFDDLPHDKIKKFNSKQANELFYVLIDGKETIFLMNTPHEEISAIWTESKSVLKSLNLLFNLIWKKSNYLQEQDSLKDETKDMFEHRMKDLEQEKKVVEFLQKHIPQKNRGNEYGWLQILIIPLKKIVRK